MFFSPEIASRYLRLGIALLLANIPSLCLAQTDRITLGPGLFTFPEIAQAVSTSVERVECTPRVRHRAAFLYLKERPRAEALKLLAEGLDIAFQPASQTDKATNPTSAPLVLDRDPTVTRQEQRWRRAFADQIRYFGSERIARREEAMRTYQGWTAEQVSTEMKRLSAELAQLENIPTEARKRKLQATSSLIREYQGSMPGTGFDMHHNLLGTYWFQNYGVVTPFLDVLEKGLVITIQPVSLFPADLIAIIRDQEKIRVGKEHTFDLLVSSVKLLREFDQVWLSSWAGLVDSHSGYSAYLPHQFLFEDSIIAGEQSLAYQIIAGVRNGVPLGRSLGKEAEKWLAEEEKATTAFLATKAAEVVLNETKLSPMDALSVWIDAYSRQEKTEVIMELCPVAEQLRNYKRPYTLRDLKRQNASWTYRLRDRVLMVKNQLAFLDREPPRPAASLAALIRALRPLPHKRDAPDTTGNTQRQYSPILPSLPVLCEYSKEARTLQQWTVPTSNVNTYWGISLQDLDGVLPGVCIWMTLSEEEQKRFRQEKSLKLDKVDTSGLRETVRLMTPIAPGNQILPLSNGVALLRQGQLNINLAVGIPEGHIYSPGGSFTWE